MAGWLYFDARVICSFTLSLWEAVIVMPHQRWKSATLFNSLLTVWLNIAVLAITVRMAISLCLLSQRCITLLVENDLTNSSLAAHLKMLLHREMSQELMFGSSHERHTLCAALSSLSDLYVSANLTKGEKTELLNANYEWLL